MRERGLSPASPAEKLQPHPTTRGTVPDLVGRTFTADSPGEKLVATFTYIPPGKGWLYLATAIRMLHEGNHRYAM